MTWSSPLLPADIHPICARQLDEPFRGDFKPCIARTGRGHNLFEAPQRNIAVNRKGREQPKRTDATDGMAGDGQNLLWVEHSSLPAQHILDLTVVQARDPAGHDQQHFIADPETDRLSDLRGFDTVHLRCKLNSRRAVVSLNEFDVRRVRLKKGANRFKAHWLFRPYSTGFAPSNRTSPGLGYSRLMWEVAICSLSAIGSGVQEPRSVPRINARRSQALALGRVETSLCHLRRWSKCSGGVSFAQAEKSTATMPLMSAKCGPQTNSLSAKRAS